MVDIVNKGEGIAAAQGEEIAHGVAAVVIFDTEPAAHRRREVAEDRTEALQGELFVAIDAAGMEIDDLGTEGGRKLSLIFEFTQGILHNCRVRGGEDDKLVRVKAQAQIIL